MEKIVVNFEPQDFGDKNQYHYNAQIWPFRIVYQSEYKYS